MLFPTFISTQKVGAFLLASVGASFAICLVEQCKFSLHFLTKHTSAIKVAILGFIIKFVFTR